MSKSSAPSQSADKYILRFPEGMRDQIADAAKANNRSMNAEIVARLQNSFLPDVSTTDISVLTLIIRESLREEIKDLINNKD